jgi:hypothetical protein
MDCKKIAGETPALRHTISGEVRRHNTAKGRGD